MNDLKDPKNQKLMNDFTEEHAPLIFKHINILKSRGLIPSNVDPEDLHFAGMHGLMDALHKYDPKTAALTAGKEGENPFTKYAEKRISGKMLDHIAAQDPVGKGTRTKAKNLAPSTVVPTPTAEPTVAPVAAPTIKLPE